MLGHQLPETWIAVPTPHDDLPFKVPQGQEPDADARFAKGWPSGVRDAGPGETIVQAGSPLNVMV